MKKAWIGPTNVWLNDRTGWKATTLHGRARPSAQRRNPSLATTVLHSAGDWTDPRPGVSPPISTASVYAFDSLESLERVGAGLDPQWNYYRRYGHQNARQFEKTIAKLEGADDAVATASGMAATVATLWSLLSPGDHVIASRDLYGGTLAVLRDDFPRWGLRVSFVPPDPAAIRRAHTKQTRAVVVESISNPLIVVADLPAIRKATRGLLIVDNTFATPMVSRPIEEGADLVLHSATKFLGGHGDLTAGVVCGPRRHVDAIRKRVTILGSAVSPFDAWLALRGVKTLSVRMDRACRNAEIVANFLAGHPRVRRVHYRNIGAMLSFELAGRAAVSKFVRRLKLVRLVPSLGDVTTTISHPASSSHAYLPRAVRESYGVTDGLVRLSVGIEDSDDLLADLDAAL